MTITHALVADGDPLVGATDWNAAHVVTAADIPIVDTAGDFTATEVEGALAELQADAEAHIAAADPHPGYRLESVAIAAADVAADVATQAELDAHAGAADPHTGYVKENDASWLDLTDTGETTLHTHAGSSVPRQRLSIHTPLVGTSPWTNMPAALSFFLATASASKHVSKIDLLGYTQVRLLCLKTTVAGAAAAKLILKYRTAFDMTVGNWSDIGTAEVSVAINVQNTFLDTGWVDLATNAKATGIFVALCGSGGDAALDPTFGIIEAEFK